MELALGQKAFFVHEVPFLPIRQDDRQHPAACRSNVGAADETTQVGIIGGCGVEVTETCIWSPRPHLASSYQFMYLGSVSKWVLNWLVSTYKDITFFGIVSALLVLFEMGV